MMKQNKSHKQTLETAQYGLEINFKLNMKEVSFSSHPKAKVGHQ